MTSTATTSILAAVYLDQLVEDDALLGEFPMMGPLLVQGSVFNPLGAFSVMCMDVVNEKNYDAKDLAAATGAPLAWLNTRTLDAPIEEVLPVLGKLALIYLSSLRNSALLDAPMADVREDTLKAVETMTEVLALNAKRKAH